jgi:hypothetical protein
MGVNHRFGYNQSKIKKMGKLMPSIDFERNENYSSKDYRNRDKESICGSFLIGGKEFKVTIHELRRIAETAEAGLEICNKAYSVGRMAT